ncbi:MAG: hypothetical protein N2049_02340 [Anaerolineales bacterium]|nr:hypothetical protein [Anaerolineales bacterium]MDW8226466.1 NfeD family protein [Anaerolineales bacterium]
MDFLLDPNVAYVFLVVGLLLMLLAILTPGTGLLEIGAVFCLVLAAYITYNIGFNPWVLIVLLLAIVPFVYGIRSPQRKFWVLGSVVVMLIGSFYLFNTKGWLPMVNPLLAVVVSGSVGGFLWLVVSRALKAHTQRPVHELSALIGQVGETRTEVHEQGVVQVAGELWSARSASPIPADTSVRVIGREGFVLIVEKLN